MSGSLTVLEAIRFNDLDRLINDVRHVNLFSKAIDERQSGSKICVSGRRGIGWF